jgi:hypothetical protein
VTSSQRRFAAEDLLVFGMSIRTLLVASLLLTSAAACGSSADEATPRQVSAQDAAELLTDRNWLDTWPESKDHRLHVFRFTPSMGGGVYQDRTVFHGEFELFTFKVEGDKLTFVLPHNGERVTTKFKIERVAGPKPFDLRLTISDSPRGPGVYYGRSSERGADLDASLAALLR